VAASLTNHQVDGPLPVGALQSLQPLGCDFEGADIVIGVGRFVRRDVGEAERPPQGIGDLVLDAGTAA
jgi:hypothetical protein